MTWREDDFKRWQERKRARGIVPRPAAHTAATKPKRAQAPGLGESLARLRNKNQTAADWPSIPMARFYFKKPLTK